MFHVLFYQPLFNLLIVFYNLLFENLGLALVAIAIFARVITIPLTNRQIKSAEKNKEFQKQLKELKKKHKKNEEKYKEEAAKLQAKYIPAQLGGCLPIIIILILLLQLRGAIVSLVNQGWHAFNEVAYVESFKREEDSISFAFEDDLEYGNHEIILELTASNGNKLEKKYDFEVVEDKEKRLKEIKEEELSKSEDVIATEEDQLKQSDKQERDSDIAVYSEFFDKNKSSVAVKTFLIFPSQSKSVYLFTERKPDIEFYLRPPSNAVIETRKIYVDGEELSGDGLRITEGEEIELELFGIDMSKTAVDFSWGSLEVVPYVILAVLVGITQLISTQILTSFSNKDDKKGKEDKKKKKKKTADEPDMEEIMTSVNKQMMFTLPLLTIFTSLGYLGGARFFPSGISLYWTVQNAFVIIQRLVSRRDMVNSWVKQKLLKNKNGINRNSETKNN